ncbi:hypothetical protein SteCoe_16208 [Stentor coeruleus]|uniref:Uncharacterized protein n=1 Tax=Stentor coeruleus TaxID=5963 RepID=A0A1R2C1T3_9CILI|nr:hypothetical protein SteCoe_16208 [Stentor coeruleus]
MHKEISSIYGYNIDKLRGNYKAYSENKSFVSLDIPPKYCFFYTNTQNESKCIKFENPAIISLESERVATIFKNIKSNEAVSKAYTDQLFEENLNDDTICIIDLVSMEIIGILPFKEYLLPLKFIEHGNYALFITTDDHVQIWNILTYTLIHTFQQSQYLEYISLSKDLRYIATLIYGPDTIIIQDLKTNETSLTIHKHPGNTLIYFYLEKYNKTVIAHEDMTVRLWDLSTFQNIILAQSFKNSQNNFVIFNGKYACLATLHHHVCIFDLEDGVKIFDVKCFGAKSFYMSFNSRYFVYAGKDIGIWNLEKNVELKKISWNKNYIVSIGLSNDIKILVTGSIDRYYCVWRFKDLVI